MQRNKTNSRAAGGAGVVGLLLGGIGIGAAAMYLFDPERGRGRRSRLGDQLTSQCNRLSDATASKARDLRNRAQGVIHEAGSIFGGARQATAGAERSNEGLNRGADFSTMRTAGQGA
ncbi:MAG: hypothetical protein ACRD68_18860 [Pyrinomonadaceae bacterium]